MRKGLLFLSPFALIAGLVVACSSTPERSGFAPEQAPDGGKKFDNLGTVDAASDAGEGCSSSKTEISRVPVVIEFVVDESGSMDSSKVQTTSYWMSARDALLAAFADMQTTADPATFIGLMRYSSSVDETVAPESLTDQSHYDELVDTIDTPTAGGGGTSTDVALKAAYTVVEKFKPKANTGLVPDQMNRVVVLLSDGVPDDKTACENIVEQKFNQSPPKGPILTFSVGIGKFGVAKTTYDPEFMGHLAQKGGTAPADCDPKATDPASACHFQVTPGDDPDATKQALVDAINKIRALSASCEFSFTTNTSTDLNSVKVEITDKDGNKTPIEKNDENGWSFDDPTNPSKVILRGDACSASNGTVSGRVDVVIGCRSAN